MIDMGQTGKVLVGLSGGLDSSYVAYLLKQKGYQVDGIHFSNGIVNDETITIVNKISEFIGISVKFVNIHNKFVELLEHVDVEMCHMRTPNICVMCARDIKFGHIMRYAIENGYDYLATGHYVKIIHNDNDIAIQRAKDGTRDQSYGFGVIPKKYLKHALTPLGDYLKVDIRKEALRINLPFIQRESRGLCFTNEPFNKYYPKITKGLIHGNFIIPDSNIVVPHNGQQLFTRGQKVTIGKYHCVIDKKLENGDIILSKRENVFELIVKIVNLNFMIERNRIDLDQTYQIQIRYNADPVNCKIVELNENSICVKTEIPVFAPTDGQIGTIYDGNDITVGGFIYIA